MAVKGFGFVGKTIDILNQTQNKINRQFLKRIEALEKKAGTDEDDIDDIKEDIYDIQGEIGDLSSANPKAGTIAARLKALEDAE